MEAITQEGAGSTGNSLNETALVECPFCAEEVKATAKKCRHCGETLDIALRRAEEALRASERQGNVYMNAAVSTGGYSRPVKSKVAAILLAFFLGGIGAHKFYLNRTGWGILYLVFCWTLIPGCIAFVEAIIYACTSEEGFHYKYG